MAKVLGEPARYVTDQSVKSFRKQFVAMFLISYCFAFLVGCFVGLNKQPYTFIMLALVIGAVPLINRFIDKITEKLERERINFRKGATGEAQIGFVLDQFPDDYTVVHDLATQYGNIDHVVVGPTGVYVIDAKNWKGVVSADGKGELLLNGKAVKKPEARNLSRTIMNIKGKIKTLSGIDPYIHGILAFPSAAIEAKWGTTGHAYCLTDEQLRQFIVENKRSKKLAKKEINAISQAFLALTVMDKEFPRGTIQPQNSPEPMMAMAKKEAMG